MFSLKSKYWFLNFSTVQYYYTCILLCLTDLFFSVVYNLFYPMFNLSRGICSKLCPEHIIRDTKTYFIIILLKRIKIWHWIYLFIRLNHAFVYHVLIKYFRLPFSATRFWPQIITKIFFWIFYPQEVLRKKKTNFSLNVRFTENTRFVKISKLHR